MQRGARNRFVTDLRPISVSTQRVSRPDWAGARRVASWLCDAAAPNKRSLTEPRRTDDARREARWAAT